MFMITPRASNYRILYGTIYSHQFNSSFFKEAQALQYAFIESPKKRTVVDSPPHTQHFLLVRASPPTLSLAPPLNLIVPIDPNSLVIFIFTFLSFRIIFRITPVSRRTYAFALITPSTNPVIAGGNLIPRTAATVFLSTFPADVTRIRFWHITSYSVLYESLVLQVEITKNPCNRSNELVQLYLCFPL